MVLIYLYILRNKESYDGSILLDVTECGSNALDVLFDLVEKFGGDLEITFLLRHRNDLFKCKSRNYVVDGRSKKKLF